MRHIELEVDGRLEAADLESVAGVRDVSVFDGRVELNFDGDMAALLAAVSARARLRDIHTSEAELEDIFLTYYKDES
nr:DUF4162 domain-containing protein [Tessaracoccus coleopterorum]